METARILAAPHGSEVRPRDGLREISHGRWEGMTRAEVERLYPDEYARWERDPFSFAPLGGESGLSVTARALPALLRDRVGPRERARAHRLAQGDDPAADQLASRLRRADVPRPARPEPRVAEHPRFPGSQPRAADSLQRHVPLRGRQARSPAGCRPSRRDASRSGGTRPTAASARKGSASHEAAHHPADAPLPRSAVRARSSPLHGERRLAGLPVERRAKDGSYTPPAGGPGSSPRSIATRLSPAGYRRRRRFKVFAFAACGALITTTILGDRDGVPLHAEPETRDALPPRRDRPPGLLLLLR